MFKKGWNSIQDEDRLGRSTTANTCEMVDSVNVFILAGRKVTIEDISEQLGIFVGTAHNIVYNDLALSMVMYLGFTKSYTTTKLKETISLFGLEQLPYPTYSLAPLISTCLAPSKNFCKEQWFQVMMKWRAL